ncbi:Uncharacterised protein [Mycobacterium tuberculosis]|uniref:Uncharacterized protein n=1 Tax=Mycobacterium tuberculosis TaxID=1773 RepID=A0A0U0QT90_MYCTX|nr:Uncharacterised protein [Mycobacterium tuberculosis]COW66630.1 Uncharacterised protein [Mycobacterium tuberculosis]COY31270.1 Uncharacterised protein [Mycobacterium tuberculosis]
MHERARHTLRFLDALDERPLQLVMGRQCDLAPQQFPGLRMGDQVIAQRQRRAQHREQPPAQTAFAQQSRVELVPSGVWILRQPDQGAQRGIGVRSA